jgi:hypothetical protein
MRSRPPAQQKSDEMAIASQQRHLTLSADQIGEHWDRPDNRVALGGEASHAPNIPPAGGERRDGNFVARCETANINLEPEAATALANRILEIAEEVERAERAIKKQLLEAADRGDVQRISHLVRRWMEVPVIEVLQESPDRLRGGLAATCDKEERVTDTRCQLCSAREGVDPDKRSVRKKASV